MAMKLLQCGNYEEFKLGVHATALGLASLMCAYNAAAWLVRRQRHLAVNAVVYAGLVAWERKHIAHHWADIGRRESAKVVPLVVVATPPTDDVAAA